MRPRRLRWCFAGWAATQIVAAAAIGLGSPTTAARADTCPCDLTELPSVPQPDFPLLYARRHDELSLEAGYWGSSFPIRSAVQSTLMYSLALDDERVHLGARAGVSAGEWAADERGPVALGLGARVGLDFWRPMTGVLSTYGYVQGDFLLLADRGDAVLRPAMGPGIRVARAVALEVSFSPLISLGHPFTRTESVAGGFGVAVSFDFCSVDAFCNEKPRQPVEVDLTPRLYAEAAALVPRDGAAHTLLCTAVAAALDARTYVAHDSVDATEAFLRGAVDNVADGQTKEKLRSLALHHRAWRKRLLESREAARAAAAADRTLAEHCLYSPFPVEIRTQLGCDPAE